MLRKLAAWTALITVFLAFPLSVFAEQKRDIRGVSVGMTPDEVKKIAGCSVRFPDDDWVGYCQFGDGSLIVNFEEVSERVWRVFTLSFDFRSALSKPEIARQVEAQFQLPEKPDTETQWNKGDLYITLSGKAPSYYLTLSSMSLIEAAKAFSSQKAKRPPNF